MVKHWEPGLSRRTLPIRTHCPLRSSRFCDLFLETILHLFLELRRDRHGTLCESEAHDTLILRIYTALRLPW